MPKIKVDGVEVEAPPGKRLLEVLLGIGEPVDPPPVPRSASRRATNGPAGDVPYYCWHPGLQPAGNCRMCLVKVSTSRKLEVACMIVPTDNLEVTTKGPEVEAGRESVLEYMLVNHPLDCPVCDKAGECKLQDYTYEHRHGLSRFKEDKVIRHTKDLGPHIKIWGNRCISCTRCVRFCDEVSGTGELTIVARGDHSVADIHPDVPLDNPMSLNTVDICPVGALIDKNFLYQARVWFADRKPTVCTSCSRGCNVTATVYQGEVKRLQPRHNADVNGHWMCDQGRLEIGWVHSADRLGAKDVKGTTAALAAGLRAAQGKVAIVASTGATLEELHLLRTLSEGLGASVYFADHTVGERWVSKSGFAIETDKTPNRSGAERLFCTPLPTVDDLVRASATDAPGALLVVNQVPHVAWSDAFVALARRVPFVAVSDILANPLAEQAQIVFASACWAERDGTIQNRDGRVQRLRTLVPPPHGARPDHAWLQELLVALELRKASVSAEGVFRELFPTLDYGKAGLLGLEAGT
jgi:NADH-quinone oxidoreductase subunit G